VRVIAGSAKGIRLGPVPPGVRPVSDRAREGIFSSLGAEVAGASVLDLYAGAGAMAIEALSRGAERALLVERDRAAVRSIRSNLERTRLGERARVLAGDVRRFVERDRPPEAPFDLVLLDPPYETGGAELDAVLEGALGRLAAARGVGVLTRRRGSSMPVIPVDWLVARRLEYGDTLALVLRRA
jgi:16S rRNA (guanine(966)-N(2))-methyltransferase RsmD